MLQSGNMVSMLPLPQMQRPRNTEVVIFFKLTAVSKFVKKGKSLPKLPWAGADLLFLWPSARHLLTLRYHGYGASASRSVTVYTLAFAVLSYTGWRQE